jgi:tRNA modification GTPase
LLEADGHSFVFGYFVDPSSREPIDEVLAAVFRAPRSFTGENSVEFSCHGSSAVVEKVLEVLTRNGFENALPGEFTLRKFLNGKTDLVEAEAIDELSRAQCEAARSDALLRLSGALSRSIAELRSGMVDLRSEIEARLDYAGDEGPEDEIDLNGKLSAFLEKLRALLGGYRAGRLRQDGALVVIAGRPNSGKSSLFNLLLREERAIVSPEPGTTRDWLESWMDIGGFAVRLVDTAGLRNAVGQVESEGVARSMELLSRSDVVIYLIDGGKGPIREDDEFLARHPEVIKVWNKIDDKSCMPVPEGWLGLSAAKGTGVAKLVKRLSERITSLAGRLEISDSKGAEFETQVRIASKRQKELLEECAKAIDTAIKAIGVHATLDIVSLHVMEAADKLGEITGEIVGEEVFERIFGSFCLGK